MICYNFPSLCNLVNNLYSSGSCYKPLSRGVFSFPFYKLLEGYNSLFWAVGWVAFALAGQPLDPNRFFFETCWSSSTCLFWASTKTKGVDYILPVLCSTGSIWFLTFELRYYDVNFTLLLVDGLDFQLFLLPGHYYFGNWVYDWSYKFLLTTEGGIRGVELGKIATKFLLTTEDGILEVIRKKFATKVFWVLFVG